METAVDRNVDARYVARRREIERRVCDVTRVALASQRNLFDQLRLRLHRKLNAYSLLLFLIQLNAKQKQNKTEKRSIFASCCSGT